MTILALIDGHNYLYRALEADNNISDCISDISQIFLQADYGLVAFDLDVSKFRKRIDSRYKQNRKPVTSEFKAHLFSFELELNRRKIPSLSRHGLEADDLIASLAYLGFRKECQVCIYSNDTDFLQHLDKASLYTSNGILTYQDVIEKYDIEPYRLPEIWALSGDRSDNIFGIVSEKDAIDLIKKYGTLGKVLSQSRYRKYTSKVLKNFVLIQHNSVAGLNINFEELSLRRFKEARQ